MPFAKKVISGGNTISKDDIDKINKNIEDRFNTLTSEQQQDAEVIDARDGETSLKAKLNKIEEDIDSVASNFIQVKGVVEMLENATTYPSTFFNGNVSTSTSYDCIVVPNVKVGTYTLKGKYRQIYVFDGGDIYGKPNKLENVSTVILINPTITVSYDGYLILNCFKDSTETASMVSGDTYVEPTSGETSLSSNVKIPDELLYNVGKYSKNMMVKIQDSTITIESYFGGNVISTDCTYIPTYRNGCFNFESATLKTEDENRKFCVCSDDIVPLRMASTIGAGHGWPIFYCTASHITQEDVGSIWTDGTNDFTLLKVDNGLVWFMPPLKYNNQNVVTLVPTTTPSASLTHKSGATHTANIDVSTLVSSQLYPSINNHKIKFYIDNREIPFVDGTYYCDSFTVMEEYNIPGADTLINNVQTNIGSYYMNDDLEGDVHLSITYKFIPNGICMVSTGLHVLRNVYIRDCGFIQTVGITTSNDNETIKRSLPGAGVVDGINFSNLNDKSTYTSASHYICKEQLLNSEDPITRCIEILYQNDEPIVGFELGYIFDKGDATNEKRLTNIPQNGYYWDMRNTGKIYPVAMSTKYLNKDEYYSILAYRAYIPSEQLKDGLVINHTEDAEAFYVNIFANNATISNYLIPETLGAHIEVLSYNNFNLLNTIVDGNGIIFKIGEGGGFAVVKIQKTKGSI